MREYSLASWLHVRCATEVKKKMLTLLLRGARMVLLDLFYVVLVCFVI
jgi:hypothetical protein